MASHRHRGQWVALFVRLVVGCLPLGAAGVEPPTTAPAADPDATGPIIEGIVVNHLGAGIAQAAVRIEAIDAPEDAPPLAVGTTSRSGDIRVRLPAPLQAIVRVRIQKEGFATFVQELDLTDESPPWIDATLVGAATLAGQVRDRLLGRPVPGARVICSNGGQDFEALTDAQGRFSFNTLSHGPATLTASAKGFGTQRETLQVRSDQARADIQLGPERIVELKIITDDERPAPDVRVDGFVEPGGEYLTAKTGPDGRITLHGLSAEAQAVHLRLNGPRYIHMPDYDVRLPLKKATEPAADRPATLPAVRRELIVHVAGRVRGLVTEGPTGEPIVGVRVIAGREFAGNAPMTWTALDGSYELTGLPPGVNVISYQHTRFATVIREVHLDQDQTATLNVDLHPGLILAGRVVDSAGKPVEQVFITAHDWQGYSTLGLRGITDKEGAFSFSNAPPGEIEFVFVKPGYGEPLLQTLTAGRSDHRVELKLQTPGPGRRSLSKLEIGKPVPDLTLIDTSGKTWKLSELRGRFVFLDCWATWCGPCLGEIDNVKALYTATKDHPDFVLIGISLDSDRDELKRVTQERNMPWPQVFGEKSGAREAFETLSGVGIPYTCLIGPDGKVLAVELRGPGLAGQVQEILVKSRASRPAD